MLDARLNKIPTRINNAHPRGITQVKWLNEWQVLSGARKGDSSIRLWDLRYVDKNNPALDFQVCDYTGSNFEASSLFMRDVKTHQKIEFDVLKNRYDQLMEYPSKTGPDVTWGLGVIIVNQNK